MKNLCKVLLVLSLIMSLRTMAFAEDANNANSGPGVGMATSTWDGSSGSKIYGYGTLNGITGNEVVAANAGTGVAPTTVDSNIVNPINNYAIDMGPTSANNNAYSLHSINDGGPGTGVTTNQLGNPTYYNDGGPGMGLTTTTNDGQPTTIYSTADPNNAVANANLLPGQYTFTGGTSTDKTGK